MEPSHDQYGQFSIADLEIFGEMTLADCVLALREFQLPTTPVDASFTRVLDALEVKDYELLGEFCRAIMDQDSDAFSALKPLIIIQTLGSTDEVKLIKLLVIIATCVNNSPFSGLRDRRGRQVAEQKAGLLSDKGHAKLHAMANSFRRRNHQRYVPGENAAQFLQGANDTSADQPAGDSSSSNNDIQE